MKMTTIMRQLARWHIWLGWVVAVPILLWTFTGLWMVARPIEEVRGTDLRSEPLELPQGSDVTIPMVNGWPVKQMRLMQRIDRTLWVIERVDGSVLVDDALTGEDPPRVDAALARRIANAALKTPGRIDATRLFAADANPIDLRRDRPAWQVAYADGLHVYVDEDSGEVLAVRSNQWRWFDLMFGLHVLDPVGREDTHHPLLIIAAAIAFPSCLIGFILLFRRRKARAKVPAPKTPASAR